jgi:hypothetical protein
MMTFARSEVEYRNTGDEKVAGNDLEDEANMGKPAAGRAFLVSVKEITEP